VPGPNASRGELWEKCRHGGSRYRADAGLREETQAGLADDVPAAELTPRSVQPYFTKRLARAMDGRLEVEAPSPGQMRLTARLPA